MAPAANRRSIAMSDQVQPLGSRVFVRVLAEENMTKSGLYVPDTAKEKPQRGEVIAIGEDTELIKVAVGDRVLFPKYTGTELRIDDRDHLIIDAGDLLAILREAKASAAAA
jgi:chaperonin GroES